MGLLRYGTSSWSEESWVGSFYPAGTRPADFLARYAEQFDTVEADVTYYRIPDERMVRGWAERSPEGFVLSAKFPRSIVHGGEGARPHPEVLLPSGDARKEADRFLRTMSALGEKCGPLVLQFPYFNKSIFTAPEPFFERLDAFLGALPVDFRYGVEIRNKSWIAPPLLELLRARKVALVWVDIAYMPHGADLARALDLFTADFAYLRLIGDRELVEQAAGGRFDRIVVDQSARLERWVALLRESLGRVPETFAYANNHYAGHGPATIRELADLVKRAG
jgi:uncharacterized protein YecE (DUF72 family)